MNSAECKKFKKEFFVLFSVSTALLAVLLMFLPAFRSGNINSATELAVTVITACGIYAVGALSAYKALKFESTKQVCVFFGLFFVLYAARMLALEFVSHDYSFYLSSWLAKMREGSFVHAITEEIGNYNMPYLYFLAVLSRFNFNDLYFIKFFSLIFEMVCAYYAVKLVSLKTDKSNSLISCFLIFLFIPTVFMNASLWGQCDVIYAAFVLAFVFYALSNRPYTALAALALAFSFKLQTVFICPLLIVFLFNKKIDWKKLWIFPLTFMVTLMPAVIMGKPFMDTISIYIGQADTYNALSMNAPSIFAFLDGTRFSADSRLTLAGIFATGMLVMIFLTVIHINRKKLDETLIIKAALIFVLMIPLFLPRMHDRYFFLADVLSFIAVFYDKKLCRIPFAIIFTSIKSYARYLVGIKLIPMPLCTLLLVCVFAYLIYDFLCSCGMIKGFSKADKLKSVK